MADDRLSSSDADRVARLRRGDERAFEAMFREYFGLLLRVANSIVRAPDIAEDVVCDVMTTLYRRRESLKITTSVEAYLVRAVRYQALSVVRSTRREALRYAKLVDEDDASVLRGEAPSADAALLEVEELATRDALVQSVMAELTPQSRLLVTLRWERGLSVPEIAEILGVSDPAVRMKMSRIVKALRAHVHRLRQLVL